MSIQDERPDIIADADAAYEAIRAINHATIWPIAIPAPVIYQVLGELKTALGYGAQQALAQLAVRLDESLYEYDVTEDDGSDPAENAALAVVHMQAAAGLAAMLGEELATAQNAIAGQGHRGRIRSGANVVGMIRDEDTKD